MITVGLPTYNRAAHLGHAIDSILGQTFGDFELIIGDDGSSDGTADVVRRYDDRRIIYAPSPVNLGIPGVLNRILALSHGDAIVMLHDHDWFDACLLSSMMEVLERFPQVGFVNPGVAWADTAGGKREVMAGLPAPISEGHLLVERMLLGSDFSCPVTACSLVPRHAYDAVGFRYDERFGFVSDVDLWLRLAMRFDIGQAAETGLVCRRRDEDHPFFHGDWRLVKWLVDMQEVNAERYFSDDSLEAARKILRHKSTRLFLRTLTIAAAKGDSAMVAHGLQLLDAEVGGTLGLIARIVCRSPRGEASVIRLARAANLMSRRSVTLRRGDLPSRAVS